MRFEVQSGLVIFHDDKPGQNASLSASNRVALAHRGDLSLFDDERRRYAWAFAGSVGDGDVLTFTTSDRQVVGRVRENGVVEITEVRDSSRGAFGADSRGDAFLSTEAVLAPPHAGSREHPVQMTRPR